MPPLEEVWRTVGTCSHASRGQPAMSLEDNHVIWACVSEGQTGGGRLSMSEWAQPLVISACFFLREDLRSLTFQTTGPESAPVRIAHIWRAHTHASLLPSRGPLLASIFHLLLYILVMG
jgi:hypothetical protein